MYFLLFFKKYLEFIPFLLQTIYKPYIYIDIHVCIVFQNGLKLPGSRTDIIRTKNISGPSPVGGSAGGTEGRQVQTLDEFEMQAAHYNIACAYARMDKTKEACESLEQAFKAGFDNYATVAADPDLASLKNTSDYDNLMSRYDKKGFNPFGLFQK